MLAFLKLVLHDLLAGDNLLICLISILRHLIVIAGVINIGLTSVATALRHFKPQHYLDIRYPNSVLSICQLCTETIAL